MRNNLSSFIGENNQSWIGTFGYSAKHEEWISGDVVIIDRYLIRDIYSQDGEYITDHIWVGVEQSAGSKIMSSLKKGDKIHFEGRTSTYYKSSKEDTLKLQKDYCIVDVKNIIPYIEGLIIPDDIEKTVINLKQAGYSTSNIASLTRKSIAFVYNVLHENDLLYKKVSNAKERLYIALTNLVAMGYSREEISELANMPLSKITEYLN